MFIPDEMKLNRFKQVSLPSARDYLMSQGERVAAASEYSGDADDRGTLSKVDSIEDFRQYAEEEARKAMEKESNKDE